MRILELASSTSTGLPAGWADLTDDQKRLKIQNKLAKFETALSYLSLNDAYEIWNQNTR